MPTYEYKCKSCGHKFEKFHSMSAAPIKKCPDCGKNAVERLIGTGAGLIFRGSGFYITDYRDAAYKEKAKADSGETATKSDKSDKPAVESKTEPTAKAATGDSKSTEPKPAKTETKASKSASKPSTKNKK